MLVSFVICSDVSFFGLQFVSIFIFYSSSLLTVFERISVGFWIRKFLSFAQGKPELAAPGMAAITSTSNRMDMRRNARSLGARSPNAKQ